MAEPTHSPFCSRYLLGAAVSQPVPHKRQLMSRSLPSAISKPQHPQPSEWQPRGSSTGPGIAWRCCSGTRRARIPPEGTDLPRAATNSSLINPITTLCRRHNWWITWGLLQVNGRRKHSRLQTGLFLATNFEKPGLKPGGRGTWSCHQHHPHWEGGELAPPAAHRASAEPSCRSRETNPHLRLT